MFGNDTELSCNIKIDESASTMIHCIGGFAIEFQFRDPFESSTESKNVPVGYFRACYRSDITDPIPTDRNFSSSKFVKKKILPANLV